MAWKSSQACVLTAGNFIFWCLHVSQTFSFLPFTRCAEWIRMLRVLSKTSCALLLRRGKRKLISCCYVRDVAVNRQKPQANILASQSNLARLTTWLTPQRKPASESCVLIGLTSGTLIPISRSKYQFKFCDLIHSLFSLNSHQSQGFEWDRGWQQQNLQTENTKIFQGNFWNKPL